MNFKLSKKYFLKKQIEKEIKERDFTENSSGLKTIGIVYNAKEEINVDMFQSLLEPLSLLCKDLKIICFKEEKKNTPTLDQNTFSSNDFKWNGVLDKASIEEFLDMEYDVFIGYYSARNLYLDYMVAKAKAPLKVGLKGTDANLFDLVFTIEPTDYNVFEKELVKYVQIIKNKKITI